MFLLFILFNLLSSNENSLEHLVYNKNTDFALDVFKIKGREAGNTIMIIGGIQGDEEGGYLTADIYADIRLKKGNIIVVPRANFPTIIKNKRQINEDMNRRFDVLGDPIIDEDKVVSVLKKLMSESDLVLNLHEGSGFYNPEYISEMENPYRFGQCIIADTEEFFSKKYNKQVEPKKMALRVIDSVNKKIDDERYKFKFNNHNTADKKTIHPEQRKSASFYATYEIGIPAFGIETTKLLKDTEQKIRMQSAIINAFMEEMDILPESPGIYFFPAKLAYLLVKVGEEYKVLKSDESLIVDAGAIVEIKHIESNYRRGLSADILGFGSMQDLEKPLLIDKNTKIIVKKDSDKIGEVPIYINQTKKVSISSSGASINPKFLWLLVKLNNKNKIIHENDILDVYEGDTIELLDAVFYPYVERSKLIVNFVGYDGGTTYAKEDDLGLKFKINGTLLKNFALSKDIYSIYVKYKGVKTAYMKIRVNSPKVKYFIFTRQDEQKLCFINDEKIIVADQDFKFFDIVGDLDIDTLSIKILNENFDFSELKNKSINKFLDLGKNELLQIYVQKDSFTVGKLTFKKTIKGRQD